MTSLKRGNRFIYFLVLLAGAVTGVVVSNFIIWVFS